MGQETIKIRKETNTHTNKTGTQTAIGTDWRNRQGPLKGTINIAEIGNDGKLLNN